MRRVGVAAILGLALGGCETHECTEMGCTDQLRLVFAPGTLQPGSYRMIAQGAELTVLCTFTLPGEPSRLVECNEPMASVVLRADGLESFDFPGSPAALTLRLFEGDNLVMAEDLRPDYLTTHPNGEDCPGECLQATEALPLDG